MKILIVDQEADRYASPLQEMLAYQFQGYNAEVIVCLSYREALPKLEGKTLAIIGLDLTLEYNSGALSDFLPEFEGVHPGYRLIRFIQKRFPETKIIVLATTSMCQESSSPGIFLEEDERRPQFLIKPVSATKLIQAIKGALSMVEG